VSQGVFNALKRDGYKKAAKIEKKVEPLLKGYQVRAQGLVRDIGLVAERLEQAETELKCFKALRLGEVSALPARTDALTREVEAAMRKERDHQAEFQALMVEKDMLLARLAQSHANGVMEAAA
jgi:pre-mRNA-splicing factor CDC5/CEF1